MDLAREIRKDHTIPIIMLTGKGDAIDRIIGLEVGADDYLPKPFELRELVARVRAVLRRSAGSETPVAAGQRFVFEGWVIDIGRRSLLGPIVRAKLSRRVSSTCSRSSSSGRAESSRAMRSWTCSRATTGRR